MLINYKYYIDVYGGSSIPELSFTKKANEAISIVNYHCSNRINKSILNNDIKNAICEISELLYSQEILKNIVLSEKEKISETVGPRSVTYSNNKSNQEKQILSKEELERECYKICLRYLSYTGLMYRGRI